MKTFKMLAATAMVLSIAACNSNKVDGKADGADSTAVARFLRNRPAQRISFLQKRPLIQ